MQKTVPMGRYFGAADSIQLVARLRDLSRNGSSAGVDLPVVREDEFRADEMDLIAVPRDPRFRVLVRFYHARQSPAAQRRPN